MKVKPLKSKFKTNGLHYFLVKRINDIALVRVNDSEGNIQGVEVHKIQLKVIKGLLKKLAEYHPYTYYESYASNSQFGQYGWFFPSFEVVYEHFPEFKGCVDDN